MANNITIRNATGQILTLATRDVASVHQPRHEPVGTDGNALLPVAAAVADGQSDPTTTAIRSVLLAYNGATWDRWRSNQEGTLLAQADRTATTTSPTQTNHNARGVIINLRVLANPGGTENLSIILNSKQDSLGFYIGQWNAAIQAANGTRTLVVYPGAIVDATVGVGAETKAAGVPLSRSWQVIIQHSGAGTWNYRVTYSLIL